MIKVFVNNVEFPLIEYSLSINEQLNERATCQFNIKSDFYRSVEKSMPIEILDVNDNDEVLDVLFVGFVDSATHKDYYNQNVRIYTVKGKAPGQACWPRSDHAASREDSSCPWLCVDVLVEGVLAPRP